jgi:hypothetical protein
VAKPVHTTDAAYIIGLNEAFARLAASGDNTLAPITTIAAAFCDPGLVELHKAWDEAYAQALACEITGSAWGDLDTWRKSENALRRELRTRLIKHHRDYRLLMYGTVEGDVELPN